MTYSTQFLAFVDRLAGRITADLGDQSGQHQFHFTGTPLKNVILRRDQELQVPREHEEVVQFTCRAKGEMQKLPEFNSPRSSAPLSDIRGNRMSCAPHLAGKPESFVARERRCRPINAQRQRMTFLPYDQLPKILHIAPPRTTSIPCPAFFARPTAYEEPARTQTPLSVSFLAFTYYLILITYYYTQGASRC